MKKKSIFAVFVIITLMQSISPNIYGAEINEADIIKEKEKQIIVQYKEGHTLTKSVLTKSLKIAKSRKLNSKTQLIEVKNTSDVEGVIAEYKKDKSVAFAEKNRTCQIFEAPNDSYYPSQWALPVVNATQAWNYSIYAKKSTIVAVIDTGLDTSHPDLAGRIAAGGYDFFTNTTDVTDAAGHGTAVSGVIAALTNNSLGVAGVCGNYDVKVLPLKVASSTGTIYLSDVIEAINYAVSQNVDVINLSLGSSENSDIENSAIQAAIQKGITVVASAGNSSDSSYRYPASHDNVISVGSIATDLSIADFSTFNDKVDLVAPGRMVWTCKIGGVYAAYKGTSFSAPMVAGDAAILKSLAPNFSPAQIEQILENTALDMGAAGKDNYFGYGLVQNHEAVLKTLELTRTQHAEMLDNNFIMQYPIFRSSDGREMTSLNLANGLTIMSTIANRASNTNSINVFTALFDNSNRLIRLISTPMQIEPNETRNYIQTISIQNPNEITELKTFVLYDLNSLRPIIKPIIFK